MKPSIPKGTRDFSSTELAKRNFIFDTVKRSFQLYGFEPIETPSFENSSTLMGKYGEEGDRLIFKILNSGDFLRKVDEKLYTEKDSKKIISKISEKALRYDLTVPFARYVVQHQNEIVFPFKRYQIQPVWRADRPQKGRFREFFQCDADVVGSEGVLKEMRNKEISEEALEKLMPLFELTGSNQEKMNALSELLSESEEGLKGVAELRFVMEQIEDLGLTSSSLKLDLTLARGLNYYTGAIFEVEANGVQMGSIGGGGRYDDLTGIFGLKNMSGVGISFGLDRIFLVMEELKLFNNAPNPRPEVLFINFGEQEASYAMKSMKWLRNEGIRSEMYPSSAKLKKQMNYANSKEIPFVVLVGEEEIKQETFKLKNMATGEQNTCNQEELIRLIGS